MAIPKRSYWLREVVTEAGTSYHISFRDGQGKIQKLCVSYDFYMAFRRLELDERKIEGWDYRHREFSEIMEETLNWRNGLCAQLCAKRRGNDERCKDSNRRARMHSKRGYCA